MPDIKIILTKTEDINPVPKMLIIRYLGKFYTLKVLALENLASPRLLRSVGFKESETLVLCRSRDSENLILARAVPKR